MCRREVAPLSVIPTVDKKADYILSKLRGFVDDIRRQYATDEDRNNAINDVFKDIPDVAAILLQLVNQ